QSVAMLGHSPAEILTKTNEAICKDNEAQMFVTVWLGILELSTGKLTAANAGHEFPVLKQPGGAFALYKDRHGFVIGGMEGVRYKEYEIQLEPGSKLFVYTDGVPEATSAEKELYGTERMIDALNADPNATPQQVLKNVRASVDSFVKEAEQFDDLTMLCLEYKGGERK
ncbi:MAG: serine/threonine-protein phosphatase, partial [Clostridia bacterium]|nr:serine/threonine-protein phosphatase [Clostridia bacterium]